MKKSSFPTSVTLKDLPPEGCTYSYTSQSGELNETLEDLVGDLPYDVQIELRPIGNAFEISGKINTKMHLDCSRCGREMDYPIVDDFRELILVEDPRPRGEQGSHTASHLVNDGPYCNYVTSQHFDIANFVHEHVAANEPYIAQCDKPDCEAWMEKANVIPAREGLTPTKESPFAVLKDFRPKN